MTSQGALIVISGFSGAGKGTLVNKLIADDDRFSLSISMTTRAPREGEEDGREYFFVSKEAFQKNIEQDGFLEYAGYVGNYYGTPRAYVESEIAKGKDVILEIEVQGALQVKEKYPNAILMFITPPSIADLKNRLIGRGTETLESINKRLLRAKEESILMHKYDFIVVNDDLDACTKRVISYIDAAKCTPERCSDFIKTIQNELEEL
ncbi:MAG: guanylate kinase [Lachnospiraceae bacterium]|nr:guanylate kinase [Lachnospiraceae bacterium]